jgi:chromosome segregation ATPase
MAEEELTAFDREQREIDEELDKLEEQERAVSTARRKLHDRLSSFPNEVTLQKEKQLSEERRDLHARIDALRARRSELRRQHGEHAS